MLRPRFRGYPIATLHLVNSNDYESPSEVGFVGADVKSTTPFTQRAGFANIIEWLVFIDNYRNPSIEVSCINAGLQASEERHIYMRVRTRTEVSISMICSAPVLLVLLQLLCISGCAASHAALSGKSLPHAPSLHPKSFAGVINGSKPPQLIKFVFSASPEIRLTR